MQNGKFNSKTASRFFASAALLVAVTTTPTLSFAAGPGGLAFGFGAAVGRILEQNPSNKSFAGVSDPVSFRSVDNINTHGFALRHDGAY